MKKLNKTTCLFRNNLAQLQKPNPCPVITTNMSQTKTIIVIKRIKRHNQLGKVFEISKENYFSNKLTAI